MYSRLHDHDNNGEVIFGSSDETEDVEAGGNSAWRLRLIHSPYLYGNTDLGQHEASEGRREQKEKTFPNVTWTELFVDLVFIGIVSQIDFYLQTSFDQPEGIGLAILFVILLYWAWSDLTFYFTRFKQPHDMFTPTVIFVYACGCIGMGMFAADGWKYRHFFSTSVVVTRVSLGLLYLPVLVGGSTADAHPLAALWCIIALFEAALWTIAATCGNDILTLLIWISQFPLTFVRANLPGVSPQTHLPLNDCHIAERHCSWILIFLGQPVVSLLNSPLPKSPSMMANHISTVLSGFLLVFSLKRLFFSGHPQINLEPHALRGARIARKAYVCSFPFLGAALMTVGTALKVNVDSSSKDDIAPQSGVNLLGVSLMLTLVLIYGQRKLHPRDHNRPQSKSKLAYIRWILRLLFFIPIGAIAYMPNEEHALTVVTVAALSCFALSACDL